MALPIVLMGVVLISGHGSGSYGRRPALGVTRAAHRLVLRRPPRDSARRRDPRHWPGRSVAIDGRPSSWSRSSRTSWAASTGYPVEASLTGWLMLVDITSQSIGYLIISISLPRLPAILTSLILLVQPVMSMGHSRWCSWASIHRRLAAGRRLRDRRHHDRHGADRAAARPLVGVTAAEHAGIDEKRPTSASPDQAASTAPGSRRGRDG